VKLALFVCRWYLVWFDWYKFKNVIL